MSSVSMIALSGMRSAQVSLDSSAHNVANLGVADFRRQIASTNTAANGGVTTSIERSTVPGDALAEDLVAQLVAKNAFMANLAVFRTSNAMAGSLLDIRA